jgi:hypothetical protein
MVLVGRARGRGGESGEVAKKKRKVGFGEEEEKTTALCCLVVWMR